MRKLRSALALSLFVAAACGGAEFSSSQGPDTSATATGVGGAATTDVSTVATGGAAVGAAGSTTASGGSNGGMAGTAGQGGTGGRDAGPDASGGGGQGGTGGAARNSGDCDTSAECGGDPCVELYPGGYRVCVYKVPEATTCSSPSGQCCKSADCAGDARPGGRCVTGPVEPSCGGVQMIPTNVCAADACTSASDCSGENAICAPAGTLGRKAARCLTGACRLDRDCTAEPGGICAPVNNPCCGAVVGLFCLYHDGCRTNQDCKTTEHCATDATHAFCTPGLVLCPASR